MTQSKIFGLVALAAICVLLLMAWQSSSPPVVQIGHLSDTTMWYLLAGLIGVLASGDLGYRGSARSC